MPVTPLSPLHGQLDRKVTDKLPLAFFWLDSRLAFAYKQPTGLFALRLSPSEGGLTRTISHPQQSRTGFAGLIITWSCPIGLGQAA